jgi:hypothetical protein
MGHPLYIPKFKKGDNVYWVGTNISGSTSAFDKNYPYKVIDCKPRSELYYGLGLTGRNGRVVYVDPDEFISEEEYNKKNKSSKENGSSSFNPKPGDMVYYVGPSHFLLKNDTPYRLFRAPKMPIPPKEFFEIVIDDNRTLTIEKNMIKSNFISSEEYDEKHKDILTNKEKLKNRQIIYYIGPESDIYEYDVQYIINDNKKFTDCFDIYVRKKGRNFGSWFSPRKQWVEENFISEDEYKIRKSTGKPIIPNYQDFKNRRISYGDTVYYVGEDTKNKRKFPTTLGGLKSFPHLKADTPYKVEFVNITAGMIRVKENNYNYPEKDFMTEEEYERLKMSADETPDIASEIGKNKSDVDLRMQIFKDTKNKKLVWTRPYSTHKQWFRTYVYLKNPPNSHLRIDVKKDDVWELIIYFHRNRNPITGVGGENPISVKRMQASSLARIAAKIEMQIEENKKNIDEEEEEPTITWD